MPIYQYHCPNCDRREDIMRRMEHSAEPVKCRCSGQMERVYTAPQAQVKAGTPKFHRRSQR